MKYVGVDLHKKIIVLCVMNKDRKVLDRRTFQCQEPDKLRAYFAGLGPVTVVVEATASYEWFADMLDELKIPLVLAHPGKLRVIAESTRKTDKLDAYVLAEFLVLDLMPKAYRPTKRQRQHRVLVRHRVAVRQQCSRIKCMVRRVLSNHNMDRRDAFSAAGRAILAKLELPAADRFVLEQLLADLDHMELQLAKAAAAVRAFAKTATAAESKARDALRSVPGVGEVVAEIVLAELGDISRFASIDDVTAYAGLIPGRRESAGKARELGITKQGSRILRWALVQAAWQSIRASLRWEKIYVTIKKRRGAKRAIVAVARRLLRVLASLWKSGQTYRFGVNEKPQSARAPKLPAVKPAKAAAEEKAKDEPAAKTPAKPNKKAARRKVVATV